MSNHEFLLTSLTVSVFQENVYIVADPEAKECIIIDPGAEAERVLNEVQKDGLAVKLIVNTHGHVDHVGAVAAIRQATGASYACNSSDKDVLEELTSQSKHMLPEYLDPPTPDIDLRGGEFIDVGRFKFLVLWTPGHSPGGLCFYGHGAVFTGDTLFLGSIGRFDSPGGNGRTLIDSIFGKLLVLPDETVVYPGHGPATTIGEERRSNPFLQPGADRFF